MAIGKVEKEDIVPEKIEQWIEEYKPNIVVVTGHDAYYKRKGNKNDPDAYRNSGNFADSIKAARCLEMSHEKLIIIAGACQSNYEELIKAGANFASSPKRVNIHALDPAIIASIMALADCNKEIDIKKVLESTTRGANGMGGIKTKGTMYIGYPR
jgi:spore coat assembly protein